MVVTRFAPSPTGDLHIGGVRTALYAYSLAKNSGGRFILRLEDTDRKREKPGSAEQIKEVLNYFGLNFDEEYKQSERLEIYKKYAEILVDKGAAFYCFTSNEEIAAALKLAEAKGEIFKFRSPYRDLPLDQAQKRITQRDKYVIRLKVPVNRELTFTDGLQGKMTFNANDIDDSVLIKSDGFPTYHLAVVVDDELMGITHVFRGVEWLPSVPKHLLLYEAFGFKMPEFYHLPLILDPEGGKLSKRKGAVAAKEFIKQGYLKEAVLNFLMLLGWAPPLEREHGAKEREIFSLSEFVEMFSPKDLNKSSPVFNREKLVWFNQKYLQISSIDKIQNIFTDWLSQYGNNPDLEKSVITKGPDFLQKILEQERTRAKLLSDLPALISFFYVPGAKQNFKNYQQTKSLSDQQIKSILADFLAALKTKQADFSDFPHDQWETTIRGLAEKIALKPGSVFMSLRIAVTGSEFSPPLYEVIRILGKSEVEKRLKRYL